MAGMAVLAVISGPPGVGKSTVADALAGLHPATRLSIDDVEDVMLACGLPPEGTGVAAYEVLRVAAEQNLLLGNDVIVDAVNDSEPARDTWNRATAATGARLVLAVLALADPEAHRRRLEGRSRPFVHIGEPSWERVRAVMAGTAPWDEGVLRLDAALPPEDLARELLAELQA
jgi:predicted kinase